MEKFRNNGAIGAFLDGYEKAIQELLFVIKDISHSELVKIVDTETTDDDCRSIQSILTHIVQSGYTYVIEIRKWLGEVVEYQDKITLNSIEEYENSLKKMFNFNEKLFKDHPDIQLEEYDPERKIMVRWGQLYDVDQLLEHAIMHIYRHRRQIKRFKQKMNG